MRGLGGSHHHRPYRFNAQPPEGGWVGDMAHGKHYAVSTHSHQKVAATARTTSGEGRPVSTHSHPKVAAGTVYLPMPDLSFQHTATRRWLQKAKLWILSTKRFNTQPPEGGCGSLRVSMRAKDSFNTQPPEGGWPTCSAAANPALGFNTQPPEGGWAALA